MDSEDEELALLCVLLDDERRVTKKREDFGLEISTEIEEIEVETRKNILT